MHNIFESTSDQFCMLCKFRYKHCIIKYCIIFNLDSVQVVIHIRLIIAFPPRHYCLWVFMHYFLFYFRWEWYVYFSYEFSAMLWSRKFEWLLWGLPYITNELIGNMNNIKRHTLGIVERDHWERKRDGERKRERTNGLNRIYLWSSVKHKSCVSNNCLYI